MTAKNAKQQLKHHVGLDYSKPCEMSATMREEYNKGLETDPVSGLPMWMVKLHRGHNYFFQTCTKDWVGCLLAITGPYTVVLGPHPLEPGSKAVWSAESGRLHEFIDNGTAEQMEMETVGVVCCQWVDWIPFPHPLLKESK
jgi:hypothetical protein